MYNLAHRITRTILNFINDKGLSICVSDTLYMMSFDIQLTSVDTDLNLHPGQWH